MPGGNLIEVLSREARQGSPGELMVESSPSRQRRHHVKQIRGCQMRLRTQLPILTYYLLTYFIFDLWRKAGSEEMHRESATACGCQD